MTGVFDTQHRRELAMLSGTHRGDAAEDTEDDDVQTSHAD